MPNTANRAALWSGTAESFVSLHPGPEFRDSDVFGMAPGQQVGYAGRIGQNHHAALWTGSAESHIDLNPPIAGFSVLLATCGSAQVGYASTNLHGVTAGDWFGTPESFVPLAPFLPPGYGQSIAPSVAFDGSQYLVGGYARNLATNRDEAFLWIGVPGPGSAAVLIGAGAWAVRRRRSSPGALTGIPPRSGIGSTGNR